MNIAIKIIDEMITIRENHFNETKHEWSKESIMALQELKEKLSALPSLKEQVDKLQRYWFDHDWYDKNEKWDWLRYDDLLNLLNEPKYMTIWETIQEYNSTHTGSMFVLSWDKWWAKTCGKISREVTKARWDIWYTAHKNFYVWEGYWIWKVILNK